MSTSLNLLTPLHYICVTGVLTIKMLTKTRVRPTGELKGLRPRLGGEEYFHRILSLQMYQLITLLGSHSLLKFRAENVTNC